MDCITPDQWDEDRRIDAVGGEGFYRLIDDVIRDIQTGLHTYYTMVDGQIAPIVVERHPKSGRLFLQTIGDRWPHNNLLHLRRCS
ncbi:MAG: DUF3892 domain-containing protein [Sphingomicrobium sp.]